MKKIALVINLTVFNHSTTGIRAILFLLYQYLNRADCCVEIVLQEVNTVSCINKFSATDNSKTGLFLDFFKLDFEAGQVEQNFLTRDKLHKSDFFKIFKKYKFEASLINSIQKTAVNIQDFDTLIYASSYIPIFDARIAKKEVFIIFHDYFTSIYPLMPVRKISGARYDVYALSNKTIMDFLSVGCKFLCVSQDSKNQLIAAYKNNPLFKPENAFVIPVALSSIFYKEVACKKENAIVLANIFDPRKGIDYALEVLPYVKNLDKIYVFGARRCRRSLYLSALKKFNSLAEVVHYDYVSTKTLTEIYSKSKVLLFPSYMEGLGIPILEAQVLGCRVAVRNKSPMKDIIIDGNLLLTEDAKKDADSISQMLVEDFDYQGFGLKAREAFNQDDVTNIVKDIINL